MRTALLAVLAIGWPSVATAQTTCTVNGTPCQSTAAAVATGQPLCSITTIPAGNNVVNTNVETQFATACYIAAGLIQPGTAIHMDSRFLFSVNAALPSLQGRVYLATTATPTLSTCVSTSNCVIILDTTPVTGLAAGANLYANADVSLTFPSATSVEASGQLNFKTTATAVIAIGVNSATSSASGPVSIPWNVSTQGAYIVKSAKWSAAATDSGIQLRQDTAK